MSHRQIEDAKTLRSRFIHETFRAGPTTSARIARVQAELQARGSLSDLDDMEGAYVHGVLLAVNEEGALIGMGGVRRYSQDVCELVRMYVASEYRRRGIGSQLIATLLDHATGYGYTEARLTTWNECRAAERLYRQFGFVEIARYNDDDTDLAMAKRL